MRRFLVWMVVWAVGVSAFSDLRLAQVFSDGMVLQQRQKVPVWGWSEPGAEVTVSFAGQEETATANKDGKFMVWLAALEASAEPGVLKAVAGDESAEVGDVLVGEVWLCSGQSNMQMSVKKSKNSQQEKANADYPLIRMFTTERTALLEVQEDCEGSWEVCSPETVGEFSAVAYFFGREIHQELDVPVGLLTSAWGSTPVEAWSPRESLKKFPAVMADKEKRDRQAETFDEEAMDAYNTKAKAEYRRKMKQARSGEGKWPRWPMYRHHPTKSQKYPGNLYNGMIYPLVPYGLRGAIWYQGENNAKTIPSALLYRDLIENLVTQWRKDWNAEFPFYAVQLVNFRRPQQEPVEDVPWAFMRESVLNFSKEVLHTGMAVGIDVGEVKDIHPKNKQAIGYRLAQQALAKTYGMDGVPGGPIYTSMKTDECRIIVEFDDLGSGLISLDEEALARFAIAGADKQFVEAQAEIVGDTVVVNSPDVCSPVAVRYAWANNPSGCNLGNEEGFPASPFRTDDWDPVLE